MLRNCQHLVKTTLAIYLIFYKHIFFWNFDQISRIYNQINYTNIWFPKVIIILFMTAQVLFSIFFPKKTCILMPLRKQENEILETLWVPTICNLLWTLFMLYLITFLLNKTSIYSSCFIFTAFLLTPFPILFYLPSTSFIEYIFDFNPTNSSFIFPLDSSFILPMIFSLTGSKTLNLLDSY